jgi:hypothetical protein
LCYDAPTDVGPADNRMSYGLPERGRQLARTADGFGSVARRAGSEVRSQAYAALLDEENEALPRSARARIPGRPLI